MTANSNNKELNFESALKQLEESAAALENESVSLEDAIQNYEKGIWYYEQCNRILSEAKQKVETLKKGVEK